MSEPITLFIPGIPAPGGSKRGFAIRKGGVLTGRVAMVDAGGQRTKDWRQACIVMAHEKRPAEPFRGPIGERIYANSRRNRRHEKAAVSRAAAGPRRADRERHITAQRGTRDRAFSSHGERRNAQTRRRSSATGKLYSGGGGAAGCAHGRTMSPPNGEPRRWRGRSTELGIRFYEHPKNRKRLSTHR